MARILLVTLCCHKCVRCSTQATICCMVPIYLSISCTALIAQWAWRSGLWMSHSSWCDVTQHWFTQQSLLNRILDTVLHICGFILTLILQINKKYMYCILKHNYPKTINVITTTAQLDLCSYLNPALKSKNDPTG